jgi:hypothetical protein
LCFFFLFLFFFSLLPSFVFRSLFMAIGVPCCFPPGRAKADLIARAADLSIAVPRPFVLLISQQTIAKYLPSLALGAG